MKVTATTELTYLDLLKGLNNDVNSDLIPKEEKEEILSHITALEQLLFKYSA